MSKWKLLTAFVSRSSILVEGSNEDVEFKFINQIEHEDGSGSSFNVSGIDWKDDKRTVHIRTQD
jgi:hypothetical protein